MEPTARGLGAYEDRDAAGDVLADRLAGYRGRACIVLAIPNGGVPVALRVRAHLGADFDVLVVRKLHIPWNREAGFGAVAPDGSVVFNEKLRRSLGLAAAEERRVIEEEAAEVSRRVEEYGARSPPPVNARTAILVDDGLASGYSMLAAARFVRSLRPTELVVAVPTASESAVELVRPVVDDLVCPDVRSGPIFAVADAYRDWRDLGREEILNLLKNIGKRAPPR